MVRKNKRASIQYVVKEYTRHGKLVFYFRKDGGSRTRLPYSRKRLDLYFDQVVKKSGEFDYKKITSKHILLGIEDRKTTPASTTQFLASMRALFKWACKQEYIGVNPCLGIENTRYKSDGFKAWTKEDMYQFQSFWTEETMPRLAFEFLL